MTSPTLIGAALREARMAQGLDITDCADAIFIRARYLTAIEDGRFEDLPDAAYVAGFVRAYADHLGVRVEGLAEPDRDLPVHAAEQRSPRPVYLSATRTHRRGARRVRVLAWSLLFAAAAVGVVVLALWLGVLDSGAAPN